MRRPLPTGPRVIVVGMGFAGLATVGGLSQARMRVTLVDRNIYSTFQPLLYQVATGGLNASDVAYPLRGFAHKYGARFLHGELAGIDAAAQSVTLASGEKLAYDYLVLGTGVAAAYFGVIKRQTAKPRRKIPSVTRAMVFHRLRRTLRTPESVSYSEGTDPKSEPSDKVPRAVDCGLVIEECG